MISRPPSRRALMTGLSALAPASALAKPADRLEIRSPDGRLSARLHVGRSLQWSLEKSGRPVLEPSWLGLARPSPVPEGRWLVVASHRRRIARAWRSVYGVRAASLDHCEELSVDLRDPSGAQLTLVLRAYDRGAAVRLRNRGADLLLCGETTAFCFPRDVEITASRDEGVYVTAPARRLDPPPHPDLTGSSDRGRLCDLPALARTPGGLALICEADRLDYPRAMLAGDAHDMLAVRLMQFPARATGPSGPGDTPAETEFTLAAGAATPWRAVLVADRPADLIQAGDFVQTLASPSRLGEARWVRPGRAYRVRQYTTAAGLAGVAFAARRKLEFIEFDWHWYGDGTDDSDATVPVAGLDLARVIAAARAEGIGVILYVDRAPAMRQLDDIVRTYQAWGVAGIKFGFVWEGRQSDNRLIEHIIELCAEHRLMVSLHDNLRPAGLERTYPNYVSLEGVRGNEQFPDAGHNLTLAFIRAVAGPTDYTICYDHPKNQTTNAHQLALAVLFYNPLTFLYWYDEPAKYDTGYPELEWFDRCPTVWDETVALSGEIGRFAAVARRRGDIWFLGAATNQDARTIELNLDFLDSGRWRAKIFADGQGAVPARQTPVVIASRTVQAGGRLSLDLAPSGGQAILFEKL